MAMGLDEVENVYYFMGHLFGLMARCAQTLTAYSRAE